MKIINIRTCNKVSGAEKYNLYLFKKINEISDVSLLNLTDNDEFLRDMRCEGLNAEKITVPYKEVGTKRDIIKFIFSLIRSIKEYKALIKKINNYDADVIILQSMNEKLLLTFFVKGRDKVIWIEHGPLFKTERASLIKFFYKLTSNYINLIIAVSDDTRSDLIDGGVSAQKVIRKYIGIDTGYFRPSTKRNIYTKKKDLKIENMKIVGFMGTVGREKGIDRFLDVSKELLLMDPNYYFIIIGTGPLLKYSFIRSKEINKNNFLITGNLKDVRSYLGLMDFLLLPTRHHEGISIAILEAMAMGVCVVTTDMGGNSEIIKNKKNGFIFNKFSVREVVDQLTDLKNNEKSLSDIKKEASKTVISKFNIVKNSIEIFETIKKC